MFEWTKTNEIHAPELDQEHQAIFSLAAGMHSAVIEGAATRLVCALFDELLARTSSHLQHEERLMRATRCPSYSWHKRQHDTLRRRIHRFEDRIRLGDIDAAMELLGFLSIWLRDHTSLTDRMMASHLRNHGRTHANAAS